MKLNLKAARINAGFKRQVDAAKALGVTKDTVTAWETGKRLPNIKMVPVIEKVYGLNYNDIIFLSPDNEITVKTKE